MKFPCCSWRTRYFRAASTRIRPLLCVFCTHDGKAHRNGAEKMDLLLVPGSLQVLLASYDS